MKKLTKSKEIEAYSFAEKIAKLKPKSGTYTSSKNSFLLNALSSKTFPNVEKYETATKEEIAKMQEHNPKIPKSFNWRSPRLLRANISGKEIQSLSPLFKEHKQIIMFWILWGCVRPLHARDTSADQAALKILLKNIENEKYKRQVAKKVLLSLTNFFHGVPTPNNLDRIKTLIKKYKK